MSKLHISSSPHIRSGNTTKLIMFDVLIALIPCIISSVVIFGTRSLLIMVLSVASAVLSEYLCRKLMKKCSSISDLSAVVTGLMYALILPVGAPVYVVILGAVFAVVVAKQLFGGLGCNIVNPALAGRAFMLISFTAQFAVCSPVFTDAVSGATPLAEGYSASLSYWQLAVGAYGGAIGETCKLAILLGFAYLLFRRVISARIPLVMIVSAMLMALCLGRDPFFEVLTGGFMFGAVFMATDYVTSPLSGWGQAVYAALCGIISVLIRTYGAYPEGTMFAILLMNVATPLIDKLIRPRAFGEVRAK